MKYYQRYAQKQEEAVANELAQLAADAEREGLAEPVPENCHFGA